LHAAIGREGEGCCEKEEETDLSIVAKRREKKGSTAIEVPKRGGISVVGKGAAGHAVLKEMNEGGCRVKRDELSLGDGQLKDKVLRKPTGV